ncbi:1-acyl-sn-glycerol-3-phosphate acyltransferase [Bacteroidia bacterium]|jgi:1-acyl-sn-glycerol-3-phosphate acyltransferase|nr:1-acyl-sn-glycerol-3-phosphate acyltransferase [Bacteroidia bacterium]
MLKRISRWIFENVWGWKVKGQMPPLSKYLIVVAPHTSNWDFMVGLLYRTMTPNFNPKYIGKKELFVWPIGYLFKALGGFPVERSKKMNFVDTMVEVYRSQETFITTITPEGTREYNEQWKTGFYFIAQKANIPIVKIGFDYTTKIIEVNEPYYITKGVEETIVDFKDYFRQFKGKYPEKGVR